MSFCLFLFPARLAAANVGKQPETKRQQRRLQQQGCAALNPGAALRLLLAANEETHPIAAVAANLLQFGGSSYDSETADAAAAVALPSVASSLVCISGSQLQIYAFDRQESA